MCESEVQVGSKIRVVRPWVSNDLYKEGDVLTVAEIDGIGVLVRFPGYVDDGDGTDLFYLSASEFEVVE